MEHQTAVEWFYQRILAEDMKEVFEQAKEMEKENLEDCWIAAKQSEDSQTFFNYYNETYNK